MKNKVALHTLGCKLNFSETSMIGNQFLSNGFSIVDFKDDADVYVFNTCTVTENAEKECRQLVRRALRANPEAFIIVTGCYAQLRPNEIAEIEGVDVVLGSREKFKLFEILDNFEKKEISCTYISPTNDLNIDFGFAHSTEADSRTRAFFKIQDGCDYKCSFCTIPLARGASRSMNPESVLIEFKKLLDAGYKEIILTGVNVGDYGKSFNLNLFRLLEKMILVKGDFRIRISSIEPNLLSKEIIDLTASSEKMCRHFHIPLQSGSSDILKKMRRRYKPEDYKNLIRYAADKISDLGIGIDVIVGFPGETDEHFMETYNFIKDLPASYLHVFTYSERPDTHAVSLDNPVDVYIRKKRNNMLRVLSDKMKQNFYFKMLNKKADVLFEAENINGMMKGFSSNYVKTMIPYSEEMINKISKVELVDLKDDYALGKIIGEEKSIDLLAS